MQRGGWKKEGWAEGERRSDEKTHRGMKGARDQGVCLGVDSMETNRPQWSPHRRLTVFPKKEHPGMLNTEKHTDKYMLPHKHTHTHTQLTLNHIVYGWGLSTSDWILTLTAGASDVWLHMWCRCYLSLDTLPVRQTHNFHWRMLIRGCNNVTKTWLWAQKRLWLASKCQWVHTPEMTRTSRERKPLS